MSNTRKIEILVGLFVAAGIAALFMLAMKVSNLQAFSNDEGYDLVARFENVGGLKVRAQVSMAGVRIGRVADISFDEERYEAVVRMKINGRYDKLPEDTIASILTSGVLGENYVGLEAGGSSRYLGDGDTIKITQSAMILEQLIGQFLFNAGQDEEK